MAERAAQAPSRRPVGALHATAVADAQFLCHVWCCKVVFSGAARRALRGARTAPVATADDNRRNYHIK